MRAPRLRLRIPEVADPDFTADVRFDEASALLAFVGSADAGARTSLGVLLGDLHEEVLTRRIAVVVVDMTGLDVMAAGCVNALLAWLGRVQELDEAARYRITFRINRSVAWQGNAVKALACFDTDLVTIEGP